MRHTPVLLREIIEALHLAPGKHVIDCTLGDAGHAEAILEATAPNGMLLGIDADPEAILRAKKFLYPYQNRAVLVRSNFIHLGQIVLEQRFGPVHGILFDLGWSTPQFEERERGFSFQHPEERLDMRFGPEDGGETASEIVRDASTDELARIFRRYGEEPMAKEIADAIGRERQKHPIELVGDLVEIILAVYRKKLKTKKEVPWIRGLHPATKVFQAMRIAVNKELEALREIIPTAIDLLAPHGRLVIISFHSLEDRIVKHAFQDAVRDGKARFVSKRPVRPRAEESAANPKARSAKLRAIEKI